jgi:hypothetical protein
LATKLVLKGSPIDPSSRSPIVGVIICTRGGGGGADPVAEQANVSGRDQLPWAGLVNTWVALPEKLSEAGVKSALVDESN